MFVNLKAVIAESEGLMMNAITTKCDTLDDSLKHYIVDMMLWYIDNIICHSRAERDYEDTRDGDVEYTNNTHDTPAVTAHEDNDQT